jgi:hypothetical protein
MGNSTSGIKINELTPNATTLTPPSGPRRKIPIQHSKTYTHQEYVSSLTIFLIREPLSRVPQDIKPDPSAKSAPADSESPKVDKPPSPQAKRTMLDSLKSSSSKSARGSPGAGGASTSPSCATLGQDPAGASSVSEPIEPPRGSPPSPGHMDSGLAVGLGMVRAHPCHSLSKFCDNVYGSQSPYVTTRSSSRSDSTAAVDTEANQEKRKALYSIMQTTSAQIDVSA